VGAPAAVARRAAREGGERGGKVVRWQSGNVEEGAGMRERSGGVGKWSSSRGRGSDGVTE